MKLVGTFLAIAIGFLPGSRLFGAGATAIQPADLPANTYLINFDVDLLGNEISNGSPAQNIWADKGVYFDANDTISRDVIISSLPNELSPGPSSSDTIDVQFDPPVSLIGMWGFDFMLEAFGRIAGSLGTATYTDGTAGLLGGDKEYGFAGLASEIPIYRVRVSKSHDDPSYGYHTDDWVLVRDGDVNGSGITDASDIDRYTLVIELGIQDPIYDLNGDKMVDLADRRFLVHDVLKVWFGDANLDRQFNSADFVQVFQAGEYEDFVPRNSGWSNGDWDGDGDFSSSDMILAFQDGGYERGARPAVAAVPEASSIMMVSSALLVVLTVHRRRII